MGNGDSTSFHNFTGQQDVVKSGDSLYVLGNHCVRKIPKDFSMSLINNDYSGTLIA
ncbi:hypothetical protein GW830_05650 [bacterium]|nr:hypothetical protein [bacterium]